MQLAMKASPSTDEVRAALSRVLSSAVFTRARRARAFLQYITQETLEGRAGAISGYAIAIAVFGKAADFDAVSDPLVRVEAGRLRSRLLEYYAVEGAADPVRIELQRGSYVPSFSFVKRPGRFRRLWMPGLPGSSAAVLGLVLIGGLAIVVSRPFLGANDETARSSALPGATTPHGAPRIFVEPFRNDGDPQSLPLAFGMTEEVMNRLARYADVQVFVGSSGYFDNGKPIAEPVDTGKVDYLLTGSLRASDTAIRVSPRLVDARTGQQVWTTTYDVPYGVASVWNIVDTLATDVAMTMGEPYGPLFDAEVARIQGADVQNVDAYHCLLRFLFALQVISEDAHARATACFEHVLATDPTSSMSWARLAALYRMEYLHDFNPKPDASPPLDRALEAARKALDLDHDNAFAHEELAFISLLRDDPVGFEESIAHALALHPSADIRAAIGINFVKMGDTERGFALIEQGMADSPRAPPFFFLGYAVYALRMHDYEAAYRWAERMATPGWPLSQAMLAAIAARTGRAEVAQRAAKRLLTLRPNFAANGRDVISRGRLGGDVEAVLFDGLARAGVELR
jgi:adenylate cyclase